MFTVQLRPNFSFFLKVCRGRTACNSVTGIYPRIYLYIYNTVYTPVYLTVQGVGSHTTNKAILWRKFDDAHEEHAN